MDLDLEMERFNKMYGLSYDRSMFIAGRLQEFIPILKEELAEADLIYEKHDNFRNNAYENSPFKNGLYDEIDIQVDVADLLGDIIIYCASEMNRLHIPIEETLNIIIDSNKSKMGPDGKPIIDERGKLQKGPYYWKPEPRIKELLLSLRNYNKAIPTD